MKKKTAKLTFRKLILPALVLLFIYFGFLTVHTFATPATTANQPDILLHQSIKHDFQVIPVDSILYPEGTERLTSGRENFFSTLTEKIIFEVVGEITETNNNAVEGDFQVKLLLRSPGQWDKELPFEPEITVQRPESGSVLYSASFELPLEAARELAETIIEEVQVRPREGFALVITSTLVNRGTPLNTLQGEYQFTIDGPLIIPQGNLLFEEITADSAEKTEPRYVQFFVYPVTASTGKLLFPALSFLIFLASGGYYVEVVKKNGQPTRNKKQREMDKIRKSLGGRVVKADVIRDTGSTFKVEVDDIRELSKLADELEKPIIEVLSKKDADNTMAGYFVLDGENMYFYRTKADR